jgi:hypothetical protein
MPFPMMINKPEKPDFPEGRIGYEGEVPLKQSVFEYRNQKRNDNWFDWFLWLTYSFCWYYNINRFESLEEQNIEHN